MAHRALQKNKHATETTPPVPVTPAPPPPQENKRPKLKRCPVLTKETQLVIARLQKELGYPVLAYWTSVGGQICQNDVMAMASLLENQPRHKRVGLFLKSGGGNPEAALRLVHLLRQHYEKITLFAPFVCASAATMVALGANEIHMGATSYLTAVDTSLKHELSPVDHNNYLVAVSQDEVSRILRLWREQKCGKNPFPRIYKYLHPLVIGALDRSSSLSIRVCKELLSYHLKDAKKAMRISMELNSMYPSHTYPVTIREARRLGLNVHPLEHKVEVLLRELNRHYSGMCQSLITDYDEFNYHNNEICNILERDGQQAFFEVNKDFHYRKEERRWDPMNDLSGWRRSVKKKDKWTTETFHIR